jgi:soluble lytic murein transglycosylase-like protein
MLSLLSLCLAAQIALTMSSTQHRNLCKWEADIVRESSKNNIEPELLAALIYVESAYWPSSVSYANACGLTQVVPKWTGGKETRGIKYTCEQLKNPRTAIKVGARILSYNVRVYAKGNTDKGLCFYNAGSKCLRGTSFYKRLYYVKKINKFYRRLVDARIVR